MFWSERHIFAICLAFRFMNALLVRTWFVPDEYYQSLEPAHRIAFGRGYLTWEWKHGLRSYVYPLCFTGVYLALRLLRMDSRSLVVFCPKLLQSFFGAFGDIHLYKLSKRLFGEKVAFWTLVSYWLSWFGFFCTPRTLANSMETVLVLVGLYHYAWPKSQLFDVELYQERQRMKTYRGRDEWVYLTTACLSTVIRPTAALMWIPLCLWHLWRIPTKGFFLLRTCLPIGVGCATMAIYLDRLCYGKWVISLWNFASFNVFEGGSAHFGVHSGLWYFTTGLPTVLTVHLIPVTVGVWMSKRKTVFYLCLWYVLFHSGLAHKEQRFLLPLVPLLCIYSGIALNRWAQHNGKSKHKAESTKKMEECSLEKYWSLSNRKAKVVVIVLLVVNLPVALYTGLLHQIGAMDVTRMLHEEAKHAVQREMTVWFLTPCCNTPFYSHVHADIEMRFLNCDPNLNGTKNYVDEADLFHENPEKWVEDNFLMELKQLWPTHLVLYETIWVRLEPLLSKRKFLPLKRFFNAHFPQSSRQSSYFMIVKRH